MSMACSPRRTDWIPGILVLLVGHLAAGCNCPQIGMQVFTSADAVNNASCWARDWADDAVLHSVFSSRDLSHVSTGQFSRADVGWALDQGGQSSTWTVIFTAPSLKCGTQLWSTRTFTVDSSGTTVSGEACSSVT